MSLKKILKERIVIIGNPAAGNFQKTIREAKEELGKNSLTFTYHETQHPGEATQIVLREAKKKAATFIAVGGDGTQNEVANGILTSQTPSTLCITKGGAGNDFAKSLPKEKLIKADVGLIKEERRYFINSLGIGFATAVAKGATKIIRWMQNNFLSSCIPPDLAYLAPAFWHLILFSSQRFKITIDGTPQDPQDYLLIGVASGQFEGKVFQIAPQANINDGVLNACLTENIPRLKLIKRIRCLAKAMKGTHYDLEEVSERLVKQEIVIESKTPFLLEADGEVLASRTKTEVEVRKQALRVIAI